MVGAGHCGPAGTSLSRRPVPHFRPQLATDNAFARWDRAHLHMFHLGGVEGLLVDRYWDDPAQQLPRR